MKRLLFFPLLAAVSCQSQAQLSDSWGSLPVLDRVEVEYHGALLASANKGLKVDGGMFESQPEIDEPGLVREWNIKFGLIETSSEAVARLFGLEDSDVGSDGIGARIVSNVQMQETISALVDAGDGVLINDPNLLVLGRTRANLVIANQTAFIDHYEFEMTERAILVDPEIDVFADGLLVDVIPQAAGPDGEARLDFRVVCSELVEMQEIESAYPYRGQAITLQVPVFMRQDLSGTLQLAADEAAILPAMLGRDGKRLLVLVQLAPTDREPIDLQQMRERMEQIESGVPPSSEDDA